MDGIYLPQSTGTWMPVLVDGKVIAFVELFKQNGALRPFLTSRIVRKI